MPDKNNYGEIIQEVLGMTRGQTDPSVPLWNYPGSGARVPPDKMLDVPFTESDEPQLPDEDNPYIVQDESSRPMMTTGKFHNIDSATRRIQQVENLPGDLDAMVQAILRRQQLGRGE